MKFTYRYKKLSIFAAVAAVCALFITACVYLDSFNVDQPQPDGTLAPKIKIGETATFVINGHVHVSEDRPDGDRLVFAMLAPRCWDIRNNVTVTFRGTEVLEWEEINTMSPIPLSSAPINMPGYTWSEALMERCGLGSNRFNDMEWVAWQSDIAVPMSNGSNAEFEITAKCKVSDDNLIASLGFFINDVTDGMTTDDRYWKVVYSDPFTVYGGRGETMDYSKVRFNTVEPSRALQDDFVTFTFSGEAYDNDLVKCPDIYIRATAYTADGNAYRVDRLDETTHMQRENTFTHNYSKTVWPAGYFGIPEGEVITHIDYDFCNADGTVVVNRTLEDIVSGTTPEDDNRPFTFNMICGN